jgi:hypothetical protein
MLSHYQRIHFQNRSKVTGTASVKQRRSAFGRMAQGAMCDDFTMPMQITAL